ncbi:Sphingosine-1-phosphate phosphatase 1 [Frankliniella fusca]|uniref:Sphingosine-1-phosphate phosphatase 1 n=1 Tax=Frankliniella fusca TaxID=407009 RepID=A0AAE1LCI5_9NEOP|nr:Sphingosine-1-phosphate phosphatase 1 [Frankliniella fusca]
MDAFSEILEHLRDPALVAKVQSYFGVERVTPSKTSPTVSQNSPIQRNGNTTAVQRRKGKNDLPSSTDEPQSPVSTFSEEDSDDDTFSSDVDAEAAGFKIKSKFWFYLFTLGTALGDELFYATFIPFWFWNVDGAVGRRMVLVWCINMYIGQGLKDLVCWPRPGYPAIRLQKKWALEYGMPSTHAMVAVSIPFSVLLYTMDRYQYSAALGIIIAFLWCSLICVSRVYLGMHSVLDIVAGLGLSITLLIPLIPLVDHLDYTLLTWRWSPIILLTVSIFLVVFYPRRGDRWTPTRGDTAMVLSVTAGVHIGSWTNFQLGIMREPSLSPPYAILWPSFEMIGLGVLRTVIGLSCILATRAWCKWASYATVCALLRLNANDIKKQCYSVHNRQKNIVELSYKFITSVLVGFNTTYLMPSVFRLLGISRPTFYTEM